MRCLRRIGLLAGIALGLSSLAAAAEPLHWSLRPRAKPAVPRFDNPLDRAWLRNEIDAFILARLLHEGLKPDAEADRATLIRRLSFDLTGLPPTPAEVAAFVNDPAADAYEKLVERLLASSHYGERWGRHWLDVVRYAETEGFEYDRYRPGAWRYRDYVIQSFNDDKPYDRFLREQLAGDEMNPTQETQVAAGFHRLGPVRRNAGNQNVTFSRNEVLTERTDIIGAVFLGLTVGCARCHNHKFDPIPQTDYYRLQAFLAATQEHDIALTEPRVAAEHAVRTQQIEAEIQQLSQRLKRMEGEARLRMEAQLKAVQRLRPAPLPTISSVHDVAAARTPIHVLRRGDPERPGKQVGPRVLGALLPDDAPEMPPEVANARTLLANWLTAPEHPLTARVMVNRVWQYHFGRGIVETPNDFGKNGAAPSHPELLDYLANEFIAGGWQLKPLHRRIVLSSTYRQASRSPNAGPGLRKDPANRLMWRFPRRRLDAEEVRDAMLAVAGRLNLEAGGPSVIVPVDPDLVKLLYDPGQWDVTRDPRQHDRRSVYLIAKRNLGLPFLQVFDQPDAQTSCPRREASTHALQALELLNGRLANQFAEAFAQRLEREAGPNRARRVERAYLLAAGRLPTEKEKELALRFLEEQPLREFALAMFNLTAFGYVD